MAFSVDKIRQSLFPIVLVGIALILRLPTISSPLARDEAVTFNHYTHLDLLEILFNYPDSNQHALFSILSNICLLVFGDHEVVFRLPSIVMGVMAIPLAYYVFLSLKLSPITSFVSSLLLALYVPHIAYSQEGRGYSLTVFLALSLILSSIKVLEKQRLWLWGGLLVISGTCMVIALPSNALFVAGSAGFCWVLNICNRSKNPEEQGNYWCLYFYLFSFCLIAGYLFTNLSGLQLSAEANSQGDIEWKQIWQIAEYLVSPWGGWMYVFFIVGFFNVSNKSIRYGFSALFLIPLGLSLITGILGFARIYIYLSPFVFMFVSIGIMYFVERTFLVSKKLLYTCSIIILIYIIYPPFISLGNYYPDRWNVGNGRISDAIKLQEYFQNVPLSVLPVIMNAGSGRSVLIHYLGKEIGNRLKLFIAGKKIEKIMFLSKTGIPPNKYFLHQVFDDVNVSIPEGTIKLIDTFGSFQVYEWMVDLSRLKMGEFDVDYESKVAGLKNSAETHALENPRAVGRNSLLINNTEPSTVYIGFPDTYGIDLHNKKGFILNLYLKPPMHKTLFRTMMVNKEASKIPSAYINPYLSLSDSTYFSKLSSEKWDWEIVVLLSSIGSGKPRIKEIIETAEKKTMVDGLQSYIIESIN